jgi:hypothetical protein
MFQPSELKAEEPKLDEATILFTSCIILLKGRVDGDI